MSHPSRFEHSNTRHSDLIRHSCFVIRHSLPLLLTASLLAASLAGCSDLITKPAASTFSEAPDPHPTGQSPAQAYVRYIPERDDDIAWENDRTAFRIYGPELETAAPPFSSGIDVWAKKTRPPVINDWYAAGEHSYHIDKGNGMDCYKVGAGRGCGGLAIWNPDEKKYFVSHDWSAFSILNRGPKEASFQIAYSPWRVTTPAQQVSNPGDPGRKVWQVSTVTLPMGSNLNRIETTLYSNDPSPLTVAIGLASHGDDSGKLLQSDTRMTWWDKADHIPEDKNDNGFNGTALIVNPAQFIRYEKTENDHLALIKVTPGVPFVYYAGACWSKGPDFHADGQWDMYINNFHANFHTK
jgi:hypothetical protein